MPQPFSRPIKLESLEGGKWWSQNANIFKCNPGDSQVQPGLRPLFWAVQSVLYQNRVRWKPRKCDVKTNSVENSGS